MRFLASAALPASLLLGLFPSPSPLLPLAAAEAAQEERHVEEGGFFDGVDQEEDDEELPAELAAEMEAEEIRGRRLRERYLAERRPSRRGLAHSTASLASAGVDVEAEQWAPPSAAVPEQPPSSIEPPPAEVFPKSHPLIGRALGAMHGELKVLRGQREETQAEGEHLKDSAQQAFNALYSGAAIRRKLAGSKASIHIQNKLIERLEAQEEHLKQEHDNIWGNLHRAMVPRITLRQVKLNKGHAQLARTEKDMHHWGLLSEQRKAMALQTIRKRKRASEDVKATEEAVKEAELAEAKAQKFYQETNKEVSQQVQALNLAETRLKASQSTERVEQEQVSKEEIALDRTTGILKAEESRLDMALSNAKVRLEKRIANAQSARIKAVHMLDNAKVGYATWKAHQKQHSDEVARAKVAYEHKRRAFEKTREDVMETASSKAGARATAESDFNNADWAWSGGGEFGGEEYEDGDDGPMSEDRAED